MTATSIVPEPSPHHVAELLTHARLRGTSGGRAGVTAAEVLKLCLGRGPVYAAPYHQQFDAYSQRFSRTHLRWGLRRPLQRLRFAAARRRIRATMEINGDLSGPTLVERE